MSKVKDIITILSNYEKVVTITGGTIPTELEEFTSLLKNYRNLSLDEFEKKLITTKQTSKKNTISPKNQAIQLGEICYQQQKGKSITVDQQDELSIYLAFPENKLLKQILSLSFDEQFKLISTVSDKELTGNHLFFLGKALLNIKLKGTKKTEQKKNLLDILWTVHENQEMNEIYESAL